MKKILFVLAFAFIGQQAFSQMYIVVLAVGDNYPSAGCNINENVLLKVDPTGAESATCIPILVSQGALSQLNQEFNNLISQGYKMMDIQHTPPLKGSGNDMYIDIHYDTEISWFFAIP
jgi:hypothetical protein